MATSLTGSIKKDLKEAAINWKVAIIFVPIAFLTYLFHEFGHWLLGEMSGNPMSFGLNIAAPKSGFFITKSGALWSALGGPVFTIIQALVFLFVTQKTKSVYAYSVLFFAAFSRFFSILFGGISIQDEARIASLLNTNRYLVAVIVLLILFLIIRKGNRVMKLNLKATGYFTTLSTVAMLIVIGIDRLLS